MKEQIEEMAKDLCDKQTNVAVVIVSIDDEGKPRLARSAHYLKNLIDAGWQKQSEGEWITEGKFFMEHICSVCGYSVDYLYQRTPYCPNCGAKMKGADNGI